jgi:hypothetical protein
MKRMSEVFNGKPCGFSTRMTDDQVRAGQHAINHIDALADALAVAAELLGAAHAECIESERAYHQALAALAAYRGMK